MASAFEQARGLDGVDADRVGLWFFSGGGLLAADWLAAPPPWLRCVAMTYPVIGSSPRWDVETRFDPVAAVSTALELPMLLTRVEREYPDFARIQDAFVGAARANGAALKVIEVPGGQHGFDSLDRTEESRAAVAQAMTWVAGALRER